MIEPLRDLLGSDGELVVSYEPEQERLYLEAHRELRDVARTQGLRHHSLELRQARDEVLRRHRARGLELDLFSLCKGIQNRSGNFPAMVLKRLLQSRGLTPLVTEEDYLLLRCRRQHDKNGGFATICRIFGETKVRLLLERAGAGGDPDIFAFAIERPDQAWFIEAKRRSEGLTRQQRVAFPLLTAILRPVEIARVVARVGRPGAPS